MTSDVGRTLREARTGRGIELDAAERATKIRIRYLRAMEEGRWEALPAPAYARGFLATYARYLGLDERELVARYRTAEEAEAKPQPIPAEMLPQPGVLSARPSARMVLAALAGVVAAAALTIAVLGLLGGGEDRGRDGEQAPTAVAVAKPSDKAPQVAHGQPAVAEPREISLELRATGTVWVCLIDDRKRPRVNGETLVADDARGPFEGEGFEATFGNGSVKVMVDGEPAQIPAAANPLGYRITASGLERLESGARPTCL